MYPVSLTVNSENKSNNKMQESCSLVENFNEQPSHYKPETEKIVVIHMIVFNCHNYKIKTERMFEVYSE